jgi:hypothetical protein
VKSCTDGAVEHHRNCDAGSTDNHDGNGIAPVETDGNHTGCRFPSPQIDGISSPVCHPGPQRPRLKLWGDRVHVGIGPDIWRGKGRLLLGKLPGLDGGTSCPDGLFAVDMRFDLLLARNELDHLGGVKTELGEVCKLRSVLPMFAGGRDRELYREGRARVIPAWGSTWGKFAHWSDRSVSAADKASGGHSIRHSTMIDRIPRPIHSPIVDVAAASVD